MDIVVIDKIIPSAGALHSAATGTKLI